MINDYNNDRYKSENEYLNLYINIHLSNFKTKIYEFHQCKWGSSSAVAFWGHVNLFYEFSNKRINIEETI